MCYCPILKLPYLSVLLTRKPLWEERKERSNEGGQASNHDEAKPPGSKPAIIALDKVRRSTWSNLPLRPRSKMPKDFETKVKVCM